MSGACIFIVAWLGEPEGVEDTRIVINYTIRGGRHTLEHIGEFPLVRKFYLTSGTGCPQDQSEPLGYHRLPLGTNWSFH
ncbi:hypothetical protein PISMIDRAFT_209874 [Pisolithus microcarpus 441]|uniref:Unplaced genomic scaffold scaffold_132, whole genome shotgun sequence n=1 Tax=Pisolithus microcarpus 441 TaxID=765257 RepID=A0A0C9YMG3_9AGAM|nr:hypothetical protein PISMIDRAFT_209874 [Pisolithus microcarpus 441]